MQVQPLTAPRRIKVVAVSGRFYPAGRAETWIGWALCSDGDAQCAQAAEHANLTSDCACGYQVHEHVLPRGIGPGDAPQLDYIVTDQKTGEAQRDLNGQPIRRTVPERITGRTLRMRRNGAVEVPDHPVIRKALIDGDLALYVERAPLAATAEQINAAAAGYKHAEQETA